jgi:coatomer protein complex subunit alpha (xenin)
LRQLVSIAREYLLGLMIETTRKDLPVSDPSSQKRNVELAAYFTHCELQPAHALLSLQVAMAQAYKAKCFSTAAIMIRRLLELGPPPQLAQKAGFSLFPLVLNFNFNFRRDKSKPLSKKPPLMKFN